jgi:hypothetical protein
MMATQMRFFRRALNWLIVAAFVFTMPFATRAAPSPQTQEIECAVEYRVQAGDWLSKLAGQYLGDIMAYPAIVGATNQKSVEDERFARITDPDFIEVGWVLCIPDAATLAALKANPVLVLLLPEEPTYWEPLPHTECKELGDAVSRELGAPTTLGATSFSTDSIAGPEGIGCRVSATANNQVLRAENAMDIADRVDPLLIDRGWSLDLDSRFIAAGVTQYQSSYTRENGLCWLSVSGHISEDATCPPDAGFILCFDLLLPPEQQMYTIVLTCAQHPPSE